MTIAAGQRVPNVALRRVRVALGMSQSEFAAALREAGRKAGEPNGATKRLVQKWESGEHAWCRTKYRRALEAVTGLPLRELGLVSPGMLGDESAQLEQVASRLRGMTESERQVQDRGVALQSFGDQLRVGGQAAALGGWLALGRRDAAGAQRYFDAAVAIARALEDDQSVSAAGNASSAEAQRRSRARRATA